MVRACVICVFSVNGSDYHYTGASDDVVKVIATGGLAILFERHTTAFDAIEPDLTIQGLALMWERAHIGA